MKKFKALLINADNADGEYTWKLGRVSKYTYAWKLGEVVDSTVFDHEPTYEEALSFFKENGDYYGRQDRDTFEEFSKYFEIEIEEIHS